MTVSCDGPDIGCLVGELGALVGGCPLLLGLPADQSGDWAPLEELSEVAAIDEWLARVETIDSVGPPKPATCAAFIIGWVTSALASPGVAMIASAGRAPDLINGDVWICRAEGGWCDAIGLERARLLPAAQTDFAFGVGCARRIAPIIAALGDSTGRRLRTLWLAATDALYLTATTAQMYGATYAQACDMWRVADRVAIAFEREAAVGTLRRPQAFSVAVERRLCCRRASCCLAYTTPSARRRAQSGEETRCEVCPLRCR